MGEGENPFSTLLREVADIIDAKPTEGLAVALARMCEAAASFVNVSPRRDSVQLFAALAAALREADDCERRLRCDSSVTDAAGPIPAVTPASTPRRGKRPH